MRFHYRAFTSPGKSVMVVKGELQQLLNTRNGAVGRNPFRPSRLDMFWRKRLRSNPRTRS